MRSMYPVLEMLATSIDAPDLRTRITTLLQDAGMRGIVALGGGGQGSAVNVQAVMSVLNEVFQHLPPWQVLNVCMFYADRILVAALKVNAGEATAASLLEAAAALYTKDGGQRKEGSQCEQ